MLFEPHLCSGAGEDGAEDGAEEGDTAAADEDCNSEGCGWYVGVWVVMGVGVGVRGCGWVDGRK